MEVKRDSLQTSYENLYFGLPDVHYVRGTFSNDQILGNTGNLKYWIKSATVAWILNGKDDESDA